MNKEKFDYEYYIAKLKNLLQFSKREYIRKNAKILPEIEGAMIYLKGILPLFSKNLKSGYYQLKNINFSKTLDAAFQSKYYMESN